MSKCDWIGERPSGRPLIALAGVVSVALGTGGCGVFDVSANVLYLLAVRGGLLSIVAVLVSLYPASTVVRSLVFLGEGLRRGQVGGVAAATAAVALITAG